MTVMALCNGSTDTVCASVIVILSVNVYVIVLSPGDCSHVPYCVILQYFPMPVTVNCELCTVCTSMCMNLVF